MRIREIGSDYHYMDFFYREDCIDSVCNLYPQSNLYFSGRSALYSLLKFGIEKFGWTNVYLPEYYCHEVDDYIKSLAIVMHHYDDGPYYKEIQIDRMEALDKPGNTIVVVNYFGARKMLNPEFKQAILIEDHSHDLIADGVINSKADYCIASLRKTLPVPTGGIVWSPVNAEMPPLAFQTELGNAITYMKLSGMLMKCLYLKGAHIKKGDFRDLFLNSETLYKKLESNAALPEPVVDLIKQTSLEELRTLKKRNYDQLWNLLKRKDRLWLSVNEEICCPFGLIMLFKDLEERERMRLHLISNQIYASLPWPGQQSPKAKDFFSRILLVPCDGRYSLDDMSYVSEKINELN